MLKLLLPRAKRIASSGILRSPYVDDNVQNVEGPRAGST
jgi:hypothetical protein